jgi:hypothetical protein
MKTNPLYRWLLALACMLLLASCGGSSGGTGSTASSGGGSSGSTGAGGNPGYEVAVNFIKGPVTNGSCELFRVDSSGIQGISLGVAENSVNGLVNFTTPVNYTGSVLIECSGGTYLDEATGDLLDAPNMRAVATLSSNKSFVVSPLTELAVRLAQAMNDLGTALTTHNNFIAGLFGIQGDITSLLPSDSLESDAEAGDQNQYLLALILISQLDALNNAFSVEEIISGLATDLEDGDLSNTSSGDLRLALETLSAAAGSSTSQLYSELQSALTTYYETEQSSGDSGSDSSDDEVSTDNGETTDDIDGDGTVADLTAPTGYSVSVLTSPITTENQSNVGFEVAGAEQGTTYFYSIYSSGNGSTAVLEGTDTVTTSSFSISGLDLSGVEDGLIEVEFYLADAASNVGGLVTDSANKYTGVLGNVSITGKVTFDRVPGDINTGALDYNNISVKPARGVTVEAVNSSGVELAATLTDNAGNYSLEVTEYTDIRIRVLAEMIQNQAASWDVSVRDNTNSNALYVLQGSLINTENSDSERDLHAASGWGGNRYTGTRSAAPFAILDNIFAVMSKFVAVDANIDFPALDIFWSVNNNTANGSSANSDIGTSYYSGGAIYILGDENGDTDEYDDHVIVHEWGHYFEDKLSRSDSISGSHGLDDRLDMRVAFGEGWGNALSAIGLDHSVYFDSSGEDQGFGFTFDLEDSDFSTEGWYSESSVQSIIYDLYDAADDGFDTLDLGLLPIYEALIDPDYVDTDYLTSIFVFLDLMKLKAPSSSAAIDALALGQDINGTGQDGSGETNDGSIAQTLPVFKTVAVDGAAVELCSTDAAGFAQDNYNSHGARDFAYLEIASTQSLMIDVSKVSGSSGRDPDFVIWNQGSIVDVSEDPGVDQETWNGSLASGSYILEVYDWEITDNDVSGSQASCFDLTVTTD